jgi:hypothetical protein
MPGAKSSRPAGLASPCPSPESAEPREIIGTAGRPLPAPLAYFDPGSSSWRTVQRSLPLKADDTGADASPIWPRYGSMRDGFVYALPRPVPPCSETGSGFWPRPTTADGDRTSVTYARGNLTLLGSILEEETAGRPWPRPKASDADKGLGAGDYGSKGDPALPGAVYEERPWPRPDASGGESDGESLETWIARRKRIVASGINGNGMGMPLAVAVRQEELWARPTVCGNNNRRGASRASGDGLATQAKAETPWPRLTVSDGLGGGSWTEAQRKTNPATANGGHSQKELLGARLNPAWEEILMGWPLGLVSGLPWPERGRVVEGVTAKAPRNTPGSRPGSRPACPAAEPRSESSETRGASRRRSSRGRS